MDMTAFCYNILRSKLLSSTVTDAYEYAELFDAEVRRVLDLYTPLCEQVDADAANTITVVCRRRLVKPNSYVVDSNVGIVGLDFHQTSRPITLFVRLHVRASSDRGLIASSPNLMKYRETSALPDERQGLLHSKHKTVSDDAECAK